jgi:proline dehydrogenase
MALGSAAEPRLGSRRGEAGVVTLGLESLRQRRRSAYGAGSLDRALDVSRRLAGYGLGSTLGYTAGPGDRPRDVADVHLNAFERLAAEDIDAHISVKLSALGFDADLFAELDAASAQTSLPLHVDALAPETVDATWLLLQSTPRAGQVGTTLPGRWRRSVDDASLAERLGVRVRVVKGQWADGAPGVADPGAGVLAVVDRLRGHRGGVAVATHDVALLTESLRRLIAAETPCAAELFFGMPFRAPAMAAERLGVPIRIYVPYGHAGAPYGIADVTHRPVAAWWLMQDLVLGKDKTWLGIRRSRPQR